MDGTKRLELIVETVRYCQRVAAMGMLSSSYTKALREPIHYLWERRNGGNKASIATFRSKASVGIAPGGWRLVYDHAIPFSYLQAELLSLSDVTVDSVEATLRKFSTIVLITKEEDDRLRKAGYGHKMPEDWDGIDPLARYRAAGIELVEIGIGGTKRERLA